MDTLGKNAALESPVMEMVREVDDSTGTGCVDEKR